MLRLNTVTVRQGASVAKGPRPTEAIKSFVFVGGDNRHEGKGSAELVCLY